LYSEFLSSLQLNRSELKSPPFVYVDAQLGEIKLLTSLLQGNDGEKDVLAFAMDTDGCVEMLTTEE
jgi:hypothetical protein